MDDLMPGCSSFWLSGNDLCDIGATFGHPWAAFGHPWSPFSYLVPTLGRGLGALDPLDEESLEKGSKLSEMETQSEYIFDDILNFLGK